MMEAMYFRGLEVVKKYFSMKSNREATDRYNFVNFFVDQFKKISWSVCSGNTKGGSITVPLTSFLTGLD